MCQLASLEPFRVSNHIFFSLKSALQLLSTPESEKRRQNDSIKFTRHGNGA